MIYISVLITAYNRKEYLIKAVDSALKQSLNRSYYEIIVIKNFKDDQIDDYLSYNDIKNIILEGTEGDYISTGIKESKGKIISFLDDDDLFDNEKLEYLYDMFNKYKDLIYLHNAYLEIDDNGNSLDLKPSDVKSNFNDFIINQKDNKSIIFGLKHEADFNLSSISINKSIVNVDYIGRIYHMTDTPLFYLALSNKGTMYISSQKLTKIRFHNSTSRFTIDTDQAIIISFRNSEPTKTLNMMNDYFQNYFFYPIIKCMFYSNKIMKQLIENQYSNFWKNVLNFSKCVFVINSKERLAFLILYIMSYILKSNKIFIKLYKSKIHNFRKNIKLLNNNQE